MIYFALNKCIEGCSNCIPPIQSEKYLLPIFCFDNNYIHMFTITSLISTNPKIQIQYVINVDIIRKKL